VGVNPVWLGMICVLGSATGFFYPSQNVCSIITYSYGYYTGREMAVVGLWVVVLTSAVITIMAVWYWPLVGIPVLAR
jgi:di/tricarboxylate transporter